MLWRNHPGSDDDTQYVWWHCATRRARPNGAPCDNPVNFGGFNDPVINKNLDDGARRARRSKADALYEDINKEFAKQLWNLWAQYTLWTVAFKPNVHGVARSAAARRHRSVPRPRRPETRSTGSGATTASAKRRLTERGTRGVRARACHRAASDSTCRGAARRDVLRVPAHLVPAR